jgi:hypothetical protein
MLLFLKFCVLDIQGSKNAVFRNALSILKQAKKIRAVSTQSTTFHSNPNKAVEISQKEIQLS